MTGGNDARTCRTGKRQWQSLPHGRESIILTGMEQVKDAATPTAHVPNHIDGSTRLFYGLASIAILAYGGYGLLMDDVYIPAKRSAGFHLHGVPAWLAVAAMVAMAANMLSVVVDHFDRRNNEGTYRTFARLSSWAGWLLFLSSLGLNVWLHFQEEGLRI